MPPEIMAGFFIHHLGHLLSRIAFRLNDAKFMAVLFLNKQLAILGLFLFVFVLFQQRDSNSE